MTLTRTNLTLPVDLLRQVDEFAGPRGRSKYVADAVARKVGRDRLGRAIRATAGALVGTDEWLDPDASLAHARELRAAWDRKP